MEKIFDVFKKVHTITRKVEREVTKVDKAVTPRAKPGRGRTRERTGGRWCELSSGRRAAPG